MYQLNYIFTLPILFAISQFTTIILQFLQMIHCVVLIIARMLLCLYLSA